MRYRAVKNLVDHGRGHAIQSLSLFFRQISQAAAKRFFQLAPSYLFQPLSKGGNRRDLLQRVNPTREILYFFVDDPFRLFSLVGPFLKVFIGEALEVIDVVEIHVIDFVDSRIEISAVADVDKKHRLLFALSENFFYRRGLDEDLGRACTADNEIGQGEIAGKILE